MPVVIDRETKVEILARVGDVASRTPRELDAIASDYALTLPELTNLVAANDRALADARLRGAATHRPPATPPSPAPERTPAMPETPGTHPLTALLDEAEESPVAKHRRKAERIRTLIAELKSELEVDRVTRKAQVEARAEVKRLQDELAAAKDKLRAATSTEPAAVPDGPSAAEVRSWATKNGVHCPSVGQVPKSVREAYAAANVSAA